MTSGGMMSGWAGGMGMSLPCWKISSIRPLMHSMISGEMTTGLSDDRHCDGQPSW